MINVKLTRVIFYKTDKTTHFCNFIPLLTVLASFNVLQKPTVYDINCLNEKFTNRRRRKLTWFGMIATLLFIIWFLINYERALLVEEVLGHGWLRLEEDLLAVLHMSDFKSTRVALASQQGFARVVISILKHRIVR